MIVDGGNLQKSIILGCDRFKALLNGYNSVVLLKVSPQQYQCLFIIFQFVRKTNNVHEAAFVLMKFIHAYAPIPVPISLIVTELKEFGFSRFSDISEDFSAFSLKITHDEQVHIKCVDGQAIYQVVGKNFAFPLRHGFVGQIVKIAEAQIAQMQQIFQIFKKIDDSFSTLAPERNSKTLKRTIFVGRSLEPVRVSFEDSAFVVNNSIIQSEQIIQHLLSLVPQTAYSSDFECGICYSDCLDGQLTDFQCSNRKCHHYYHSSCLLSWFKANPACQCNFNYYTGPCLFCEQVIVENVFLCVNLILYRVFQLNSNCK